MASVRKLDSSDPKSPWIVEYTDSAGKRRRKTPKTGLKKDADALRQKIEREMGDDVHTADRASVKMSVLCDDYLRALSQRMRDGRIGYSRYRVIESLLRIDVTPVLGNVALCDLTARHVEELYESIVKRGCSPRYARDKLRNLLLVERHAVRRGYTKKIVAAGVIEELRGLPSPRIDTFSPGEVKRLLLTASLREHGMRGFTERGRLRLECYVNVAAFCGLRFGEISGLSLDDVDFSAREIHVRHNMTSFGEYKGPKSKAGVRTVPMPAHLAEMLRGFVEAHYLHNEKRIVFWCLPPKAGSLAYREHLSERRVRKPWEDHSWSTRGVFRQNNFYRQWQVLLERAGIPSGRHFHALRHFCASYWIENSLPIPVVSKMLGHAKSDMTMNVYAHAMKDQSRQHEEIGRIASTLVPPRLLPAPGDSAPSRRRPNPKTAPKIREEAGAVGPRHATKTRHEVVTT